MYGLLTILSIALYALTSCAMTGTLADLPRLIANSRGMMLW